MDTFNFKLDKQQVWALFKALECIPLDDSLGDLFYSLNAFLADCYYRSLEP